MQRNIIKHTLINRVLICLLSCLMMTTVHAAKPLWTLTPAAGSNPTQTVAENGTANVQYIVQNQSHKSKRLAILPIPGVKQTAPCQIAPKGQSGSSCTLNLAITGSSLPKKGAPRVALSRERFRDIQVAEIDSPTREVFWPRLSCVRHVALNAQAYAYHNDSTAA